jgi:dTDP-D-glucose 4,6-dehydratase
MKTKDIERVIVTGGVGFIDSHLIDNIITQDTHVTVFDNITNETLQNIKQRIDKPNLTFIKGDLPNPSDIKKLQEKHHDLIFHLAANPEVRVGSTSPDIHYKQNVSATYNLLETARKAGNEQLKKRKSTHIPTKIPIQATCSQTASYAVNCAGTKSTSTTYAPATSGTTQLKLQSLTTAAPTAPPSPFPNTAIPPAVANPRSNRPLQPHQPLSTRKPAQTPC